MENNLVVSFVGQKISKICWCNHENITSSPTDFITGSYDCLRSLITRWQIPDGNEDSIEPVELATYDTAGSITDLHSISTNQCLYANSNGDVGIIHYDPKSQTFDLLQQWTKLHHYTTTNESAACTCIAENGNEIVTGGEDGCLHILQMERSKPVASISQADSSNITGVQYLSNREIVSINTTGQLKLWDIRLGELNKPQKVLTLNGNACPLISMDKHPNQPHILVTGHGNGEIGIWDIRQEKSPVTLIDAHEAEVWEVRFHPVYSDNLFTCSQDGSCWFWNGTNMISEASHMKLLDEETRLQQQDLSSSVWLYIDANKHKMDTYSLLPFKKGSINCFDVTMETLICGTDNESIVIVNDIPIRS